jgi:hypothetical protein
LPCFLCGGPGLRQDFFTVVSQPPAAAMVVAYAMMSNSPGRTMRATRRVLFLLLATLILMLFSAVPGVSSADTPDSSLAAASRQLADKIAAALPPRQTIFLDLRNLSSLSGLEVAEVRRTVESELQSRGLQLAPESVRHVEVRLTLSETPDGFLWVVEVPRAPADAPQVEMVSLPKPRGSGTAPRALELLLEKKLIWEQEEQILDLALLDPPGAKDQRMVILEPTRIAIYDQKDGRWEARQGFPIVPTKPWPRDLRGRLYYQGTYKEMAVEGLQATLPGTVCSLTLQGVPAAPKIECAHSDKTGEEDGKMIWLFSAGPVLSASGGDLAPSRNFFTGQLYGENGWKAKVEPFYSAAFVRTNETIHVGLDGRARLYDANAKSLATFSGWGSDLTTVKTNCGSSWQVLATRAGDWTEPDAIQAYEIHEHEVVAVSGPVNLPGPVMSLGPETPSSFGEPKGPRGGAIAVVRNLKTGRYEAYQLSISCGR